MTAPRKWHRRVHNFFVSHFQLLRWHKLVFQQPVSEVNWNLVPLQAWARATRLHEVVRRLDSLVDVELYRGNAAILDDRTNGRNAAVITRESEKNENNHSSAA
jgi:hypothetical protein